LKLLYEFGRGRFCWTFRELGLCPKGIEEPRENFKKARGMVQFAAIQEEIDGKETRAWEPRVVFVARSWARSVGN